MSGLFPATTDNRELPDGRPAPSFPEQFEQGRWWFSSKGWVRVKDMHPNHRANAAALLLRKAEAITDRLEHIEILDMYAVAPGGVWNMLENVIAARYADPEKWVKGTKLYRSLTKERKSDTPPPAVGAVTEILTESYRALAVSPGCVTDPSYCAAILEVTEGDSYAVLHLADIERIALIEALGGSAGGRA